MEFLTVGSDCPKNEENSGQAAPAVLSVPAVPEMPPPTGVAPAATPLFPEVVPPPACSRATCTAGHSWVPRLTLVACGGCNAPTLAICLENCPYCNEPVARMVLRGHRLPAGSTRVPENCRGEPIPYETVEIEMNCGLHERVDEPKAIAETAGEVASAPTAG